MQVRRNATSLMLKRTKRDSRGAQNDAINANKIRTAKKKAAKTMTKIVLLKTLTHDSHTNLYF